MNLHFYKALHPRLIHVPKSVNPIFLKENPRILPVFCLTKVKGIDPPFVLNFLEFCLNELDSLLIVISNYYYLTNLKNFSKPLKWWKYATFRKIDVSSVKSNDLKNILPLSGTRLSLDAIKRRLQANHYAIGDESRDEGKPPLFRVDVVLEVIRIIVYWKMWMFKEYDWHAIVFILIFVNKCNELYLS